MDQGSSPYAAALPRREDAADQLQALGAVLEQAGYSEAAQLAFKAAANLDLADPELQRSWGGPLNGQRGRSQAFLALLAAIDAAAVVETGTYRGTTTEWIAANFRGDIYTCEIEPRLFYQACEKLAGYTKVTCALKDSRAFLRELLPNLNHERAALFYLDAHWQDDLPLQEELSLILNHHPHAVIMIDDFAVPYDPGYAWDNYGPGKQLTLDLLSVGDARDAHLFFPALPSQAETGARRGCCVLTKDAELAGKIAALVLFRGADWRDWRLVELTGHVERLERDGEQLRQLVTQTEAALRAAVDEAAAIGRDEVATARAELERVLTEAAQQAEAHARERAELEGALTRAEQERANLDRLLAEATASVARASEELAREEESHRQVAAELDAALAAAAERHTCAKRERDELRESALNELRARERVLAERDAQLTDLQARIEGERAARVQLADQLRIMKAYSGIIE
jgi:predicted O-methyltransferase YrrM